MSQKKLPPEHMNKRIEQLANQATDDILGVKVLDKNKFANLILTEVYDILASYRGKIIFTDGFEYNCVHPIQAIQKHFEDK